MNQHKSSSFKAFIRKMPFWVRALASGLFFFIGFFLFRFGQVATLLIGFVFLIAGLLAIVWTVFVAFRKTSPTLKDKKSSPRWLRIVVFILVLPGFWITSATVGFASAATIAPFSPEEIAAQEKYEAELDAREAENAKKEQAAKLEAEQKAAAEAKQKAAEKAQKAATEEQKKAAEEKKKAQEAAAAEKKRKAEAKKKAAEQKQKESEEREKKIAELKKSDPLKYMQQYCAVSVDSPYVEVDLDSKSFFLNTGSGSDELGLIALYCVYDAMEFSSPLISSIDTTNALAGTKTWSEKGYFYQWTYHPESGLSLSGQKE